MSSEELKKLQDECHDDLSIQDFEGKQIPCIGFEQKQFYEILAKVAGKPLSVDTNLNILQDGLGNVFVEVTLTFSKGNIVEKFLVNAKTHLTFFEALAKTSMLALSSPKSNYGKDNVFMIQLPRPEKAQDALDIIQDALIPKN